MHLPALLKLLRGFGSRRGCGEHAGTDRRYPGLSLVPERGQPRTQTSGRSRRTYFAAAFLE
jgi:hypothetical protein